MFVLYRDAGAHQTAHHGLIDRRRKADPEEHALVSALPFHRFSPFSKQFSDRVARDRDKQGSDHRERDLFRAFSASLLQRPKTRFVVRAVLCDRSDVRFDPRERFEDVRDRLLSHNTPRYTAACS